ncbi:MAG: hypothetical protein NT062_30165 [Proteobacteria bacterium]|nr:hypothetical protein [Pseudomonadota bacterium]
MRASILGVVVVAQVVGSGCSRTFEAAAVQPNPLIHPSETLRRSEKITIVTGDLDLVTPAPVESTQNASQVHNSRYPLINQASFTMVSRDRLRFHVQVDHKWEDWANPTTWKVDLTDDRGHHWSPEAAEHARTKIMTTMWDREVRTARCDARGRDGRGDCITTVGTYEDGWKNRQSMGNISVFRGNADFVFYDRDLMTPNLRWLKLTVSRTGQAFEYTWRFQDTVASAE